MITEDVFEVNGVKLSCKTKDRLDCEGCYFEADHEFDCLSMMHQKIIPNCSGSQIIIFIEAKD